MAMHITHLGTSKMIISWSMEPLDSLRVRFEPAHILPDYYVPLFSQESHDDFKSLDIKVNVDPV